MEILTGVIQATNAIDAIRRLSTSLAGMAGPVVAPSGTLGDGQAQ